MPIWHRQHETARVAVHLFGFVLFMVSLGAILGVLSGHPALYTWGLGGLTSFPDAASHCIIGLVIFIMSRGEPKGDRNDAGHDNTEAQ
jgi:hypothetical protein